MDFHIHALMHTHVDTPFTKMRASIFWMIFKIILINVFQHLWDNENVLSVLNLVCQHYSIVG